MNMRHIEHATTLRHVRASMYVSANLLSCTLTNDLSLPNSDEHFTCHSTRNLQGSVWSIHHPHYTAAEADHRHLIAAFQKSVNTSCIFTPNGGAATTVTCTASTAGGNHVLTIGSAEACMNTCTQIHEYTHTNTNTHFVACSTIDGWDCCAVMFPVCINFEIHTFGAGTDTFQKYILCCEGWGNNDVWTSLTMNVVQ